MKRKIDLVEEEHESEHEESESSGDESEDEEPRIKDVLSHLSRAVSEKRAFDLLHSMAASKDILFWTPSGQLLRNKRTIPLLKRRTKNRIINFNPLQIAVYLILAFCHCFLIKFLKRYVLPGSVACNY